LLKSLTTKDLHSLLTDLRYYAIIDLRGDKEGACWFYGILSWGKVSWGAGFWSWCRCL